MVLGFGHFRGQQEPGAVPPHPQTCGPGAGGPRAGGPALAMGCLWVTAPTAGVAGWLCYHGSWQMGGFSRGSREAAAAACWPSCSTTAL